PQLLDHRRADQAADDGPRAKLIQRDAALQREHGAGEEAGEQDHGERGPPDCVELLDEVVAVEGTRDGAARHRYAEPHVFLHLEHGVFQPGVDEIGHARQAFPSRYDRPSSWSRSRLMSSRIEAAFSKSRLAAAVFIWPCSSLMWASMSAGERKGVVG